MARRYCVGEIHFAPKGIYWAIPNFSDLPQISETIISSPPIKFGHLCWTLYIYPNGSLIYSSVGWVGIAASYGWSCESDDSGDINVRLSITTRLQEIIVGAQAQYKNMMGYKCPKLIHRAQFDLHKSQIMPLGTLYILFSIVNEKDESILYQIWDEYNEIKRCNKISRKLWLEEHNLNGEKYELGLEEHNLNGETHELWLEEHNLNGETHELWLEEHNLNGETSGCKKRSFEPWLEQGNQSGETSGVADIKKIRRQKYSDASEEMSIVSKEEMDKICEKEPRLMESCTQTEETSGESKLRKNCDVACNEAFTQTEEGMGVWWLKQDFEKMLENENGTDIILTVQDRKFRAHRFILGARAPAFLSVINDTTKKDVTPVIDLTDVDFDDFSNFLHYLYTGIVINLTSEKAVKLYSVAVKYQVNELKQYCVNHLLSNVSVDNFGKVFALSHQYNEKDLNDACIKFFQEKSLDIIMSTNWQDFLCENPVIGNGLFIKHLQLIESEYCKK